MAYTLNIQVLPSIITAINVEAIVELIANNKQL